MSNYKVYKKIKWLPSHMLTTPSFCQKLMYWREKNNVKQLF